MTKKLVNLAEFNELTEELQFDLLQKEAVHIGKRTVNGLTVILYQLHGFYVEVHYLQYRKQAERIITSIEPDILQPYLDQIHIRDLDQDRHDG